MSCHDGCIELELQRGKAGEKRNKVYEVAGQDRGDGRGKTRNEDRGGCGMQQERARGQEKQLNNAVLHKQLCECHACMKPIKGCVLLVGVCSL